MCLISLALENYSKLVAENWASKNIVRVTLHYCFEIRVFQKIGPNGVDILSASRAAYLYRVLREMANSHGEQCEYLGEVSLVEDRIGLFFTTF